MENQCHHLKELQRNKLTKLLQKFEELSNRKLDTWKTDPVYFELKQDGNLICSRPYPVPMVNKEMFKNKVEPLVLLGFLERANNSEQGSPYFTQHKHKSNQVNFLSDFITIKNN